MYCIWIIIKQNITSEPNRFVLKSPDSSVYEHVLYFFTVNISEAVLYIYNTTNYTVLSVLVILLFNNKTRIGFMASINNYIHVNSWDAISHPCPNFKGNLVKQLMKLWHGLVIIDRIKRWMCLLIHALISNKPY